MTITIEDFAAGAAREAAAESLGTKLIANFGALFPPFEGLITEIDEDGWVTIENPEGEDHA